MPEMPEVEIIRRGLEPHLVGKRLESLDILLERQLVCPTAEELKAHALGRTVAAVRRRGKYLILSLGSYELIFHLRMTGSLVAVPAGAAYENAHTRAIFYFSEGMRLYFADIRTFGVIAGVAAGEYAPLKGLAALGPEPLSRDFTPEYLQRIAAKKNVAVKNLILDQKKIAGIGNIYADEALFLAGIAPKRSARELSKSDCALLYEAINKVIADGIADGGTTFRDYRNGEGEKGAHQEHLFVYNRDGEPCKRCGEVLAYTKVGGRGTRYCPHCQGEARRRIIGLTGGIASGKSTVSSYLSELGARVVDADKIAHELSKPGGAIYEAYLGRWGERVLKPSRELDRAAVGEIVFKDAAERRWMNETVQPLIKKQLVEELWAARSGMGDAGLMNQAPTEDQTNLPVGGRFIEPAAAPVIFDVPLLFEAGLDYLVDETWLVIVPEDVQIARLIARSGGSEEAARARIASQMPQSEKAKRAEVTIDNSGTVEETKRIVLDLWKERTHEQ